jgi:DNA-binding NtrC family response regulator
MSISDSAYPVLLNHEYSGNYRELENILRGAVLSARRKKRNQIVSEDLRAIIGDTGGLQTGGAASGAKSDVSLDEIKLRDVIDFADRVKASAVECKVDQIIRSGRDMKSVLREEGLPEKEYQNFLKRIKKITGKGIRDFAKTTTG